MSESFPPQSILDGGHRRLLDRRVRLLCETIRDAMSQLRELKSTYPELKCAYYLHPGSILNAYREGDLSFEEAVALLEVKGRGEDSHSAIQKRVDELERENGELRAKLASGDALPPLERFTQALVEMMGECQKEAIAKEQLKCNAAIAKAKDEAAQYERFRKQNEFF